MKKIFFLVFLFFSLPVLAAPSSHIEKKVLDNGLTVLFKSMPSSQTASIYIYVKTGSAKEGEYLGSGVSHFVEHMLFKGTQKRPAGAIPLEVKKLGGRINASTSLDYTVYTLDVPHEHFDQALDILTDMTTNAVIDPVELEKERKVIHGEMRLYTDRPERKLSDMVFQTVYQVHPYRHPIIGYLPLFDSLTRDDIYKFYKSRYIPHRMIVSIAGPLESEYVFSNVEKSFKDFKPQFIDLPVLPEELMQIMPRFKEDYYQTPLTRLSLSFPTVSANHPDVFALDVLSMALGQGQSSRLFQELYLKQKLVEGLNVSHFSPESKGLFEFELSFVENNKDLILGIIQEQINKVKKNGLSNTELAKIKKQVITQFIASNQTSSGVAMRAAIEEAITGDPNFSANYVQIINQITNNDIIRVARHYLKESTQNLVILWPLDKKPSLDSTSKVLLKNNAEQFILPNGLRIILKPDSSVDLISLYLVMQAGSRVEMPELNGLNQLTSGVWELATNKMRNGALKRFFENNGVSVGSLSGKNSLGLWVNYLTMDQQIVLPLIMDLIKNPAFDSKDIQRYRLSMINAVKSRDDDISQSTQLALSQLLFETHPLRLDMGGEINSLENIKREDIVNFYQQYRKSENMVLSVVGNFDPVWMREYLEKELGNLPKDNVTIPMFKEPGIKKMRLKENRLKKEQAMVTVGFHAPSMLSQDRWAMEIIRAVMGSSLSGRLFIKIREELGQAYTVSANYSPSIDIGMINFFALTNKDKADSVKEIILSEIRNIVDKGISQEELLLAKNSIKGSYKMSLNTFAAVASTMAFDEIYGLGYDFYLKYPAIIDAVTLKDVERVAKEYLSLEKGGIVVTIDK